MTGTYWNGIDISVNETPNPDLAPEGVRALRPYEAKPVAMGMPEIDAKRALAVKAFVDLWYRGKARYAPITIMGDAGGDYDSEARDLGWLIRNFDKRYTGTHVEKTGWHDPYVVPDGDGVGNARYNQVLHTIANLVTTPSINDLKLALGTGLMHACTGYFWGGKYAGQPRAEKGVKAYGDQNDGQPGGKSKWWPEQLAVLVTLFPHPMLLKLWRMSVEAMLAIEPVWWNGKWGVRGPANYGKMLAMLYYLGFDVEERARWFLSVFKGQRGFDSKLWPNAGNADVESPWQYAQGIETVEVLRPIAGLETYWHHSSLAALLGRHTKVENGARAIKYRVSGPEADYRYSTTNAAHGYRMARALGMDDLAREFWREAYEVEGLDRIDYPPGGPNHSKSLLIRANGLGGEYRAFEALRPFVGAGAVGVDPDFYLMA